MREDPSLLLPGEAGLTKITVGNTNPNADCPEDDKKRSYFGCHAWVEVQLDRGGGLQRYAVDITHALLVMSTNTNVPESGTKLRAAYLLSNRDDQGYYAATETGNQIVQTASQPNGDCCMAPPPII